jgi:hypothetical protein
VRLDANDYSVHPAVVGGRVEVAADPDRVRVWCDGHLVAQHGRCWARHPTLSDPADLAAAAHLRQQRAAVTAVVTRACLTAHAGSQSRRAARTSQVW